MTQLEYLRQPVAKELQAYKQLFDDTLTHTDEFMESVLTHIRSRQGKMMRPLLVLLVAKEHGDVPLETLRAAVSLELLHTASLVHDDVVDDSNERRGQASTKAVYDNKVAVLMGDYLLSRSLHQAALTGSVECVDIIAQLGGTLSEGEVFQLCNIRNEESTEEAYFRIITNKTAALFAACAQLGARSAGASENFVEQARKFGELVGLCFQIRDDIFDYFDDANIGKPTGSDMAEGKITLPAIYALRTANAPEMHALAARIKCGEATKADIETMISLAKTCGGIDYARATMERLRKDALTLLDNFSNGEVREALIGYLDFVIGRDL